MSRPRVLAIQPIDTRWSKDERGPEHGRRRKALPDAYPFAPPGDASADWLHRVEHRASAGYAPEVQWTNLSDPDCASIDRPVTTRIDGNHLEIALGEMLQFGKVAGPGRRGTMARLPFGKRVTIRLNNVFDGDCQRHYSEHVVHVGFAARATLDLPLFRQVDLRRVLY